MDIPESRRGSGEKRRQATSLMELFRADWEVKLRSIQAGFPVRWLDQFIRESRLPGSGVQTVLLLSPRSLARRRATGRLTSTESDRLFNLARLFRNAALLFDGDGDAARAWFTTPARALGFVTPLQMARTEAGRREVEAVLGRLEHGVYT